jgi:hypothetical protein
LNIEHSWPARKNVQCSRTMFNVQFAWFIHAKSGAHRQNLNHRQWFSPARSIMFTP